jgi:ribosomal protein S18 acetylase RimI-like enzyme
MNIFIRNARQEDLPALLDLYVHLNTANAVLSEDGYLEEAWQQILSDPKVNCLVADADGALVGSCILVIVPNLTRRARFFGVIENVVTHTDYRRQGVGTKLMRHALGVAWEQNCYEVMLLSGAGRPDAHQFYESLGFKRDSKVGFVALHDDKTAGR